eukprot:TRINITY_DN5701_c0_g1_i2.p1 TRINITY_DN5701_c0_g1~~TRINITY_DN5701_c0_g1_i2.p1  ORF type:complete len:423 (-),score=126.45 TRINITY_DN5701_c0_g1_i2:26-1294(-)
MAAAAAAAAAMAAAAAAAAAMAAAAAATAPTATAATAPAKPKVDLRSGTVQLTEGRPYAVTVATDDHSCVAFLASRYDPRAGEALVVGFDVEFSDAGSHCPALIQIAFGGEKPAVLLVHTARSTFGRTLPQPLVKLLESGKVFKVGVSVMDDLRALSQQFGVRCAGGVDIGLVALNHGLTTGYRGLKELTKELLGHTYQAAMGWKMPLDQKHLTYAATDAAAGLELASLLHEKLCNPRESLPEFVLRTRPPLSQYQDLRAVQQQARLKLQQAHGIWKIKAKEQAEHSRSGGSAAGQFKLRLEDASKRQLFKRRAAIELDDILTNMKAEEPQQQEQAEESTAKKRTDTVGADVHPLKKRKTTSQRHAEAMHKLEQEALQKLREQIKEKAKQKKERAQGIVRQKEPVMRDRVKVDDSTIVLNVL